MNSLPTLYSRTSKGAVQVWTITVDGPSFFTEEGLLNGKFTKSTPTICEPKNPGKKNATTAEAQAAKEAQAKWQKKLDKGYKHNLAEIDEVSFFEPMLAKDWNDYNSKVSFPLYSQPKLDGMRCVARASGLFSRNGKPIKGVPHVVEQLKPFFEKNPDAILDGELYCDKLKNDFNKIISLVRKADPTPEEIAEAAAVIQYWVYDLGHCGTMKFSDRKDLIPDICKDRPALVVVPTYALLDFTDVNKQFEEYVAAGYEGQIIRQDEKYENKRSEYLLKHKEFKDEEFEILEVGEGVGNKSGMAGFMVLKLSDDKTFRSNIKGSFDFMRELLRDKASLVGKKATVKFFNYTPDGVPRFPYVTSIRDYE